MTPSTYHQQPDLAGTVGAAIAEAESPVETAKKMRNILDGKK